MILDCCINSDIGASGCIAESVGGISEVYVFNHKDLAGYSKQSRSCVNAISLCADKCIYVLKFNRQSSDFGSDIENDNGIFRNSMFVEGSLVVADCATADSIRNALGSKAVMIIRDNAGKYWIGGLLVGFDVMRVTFNSGKLRTDESSTLLRFEIVEPGISGGWFLYEEGDATDTPYIRSILTRDKIKELLCGETEETCGCGETEFTEPPIIAPENIVIDPPPGQDEPEGCAEGIATSFSYNIDANLLTTITPIFQNLPDTIASVYWIFGDGQSETRFDDSAFTHQYNAEAVFNVFYTITLNNGCQYTGSGGIKAFFPQLDCDQNMVISYGQPVARTRVEEVPIASWSTYGWLYRKNVNPITSIPYHYIRLTRTGCCADLPILRPVRMTPQIQNPFANPDYGTQILPDTYEFEPVPGFLIHIQCPSFDSYDFSFTGQQVYISFPNGFQPSDQYFVFEANSCGSLEYIHLDWDY